MYKLLVVLLISIFAFPLTSNAYLCGKVKIVDRGEDVRVKLVTRFPDLKVKLVRRFPNKIGEWQMVRFGEDFKVKFVEHNEDIRVQFDDRI